MPSMEISSDHTQLHSGTDRSLTVVYPGGPHRKQACDILRDSAVGHIVVTRRPNSPGDKFIPADAASITRRV